MAGPAKILVQRKGVVYDLAFVLFPRIAHITPHTASFRYRRKETLLPVDSYPGSATASEAGLMSQNLQFAGARGRALVGLILARNGRIQREGFLSVKKRLSRDCGFSRESRRSPKRIGRVTSGRSGQDL